MPYFQDTAGKLHFLSDTDIVNVGQLLLPVGSIKIADEEAAVVQAPPPITGNALLLSQITTLEASITQRRQREAILGIDNGWLEDVNAQIVALRAKLK